MSEPKEVESASVEPAPKEVTPIDGSAFCRNCGQAKFYHRLMRPGMILWCKVEDQETQFDPVEELRGEQ